MKISTPGFSGAMRAANLLVVLFLFVLVQRLAAQAPAGSSAAAQRVTLATRVAAPSATLVEAGAVPGSQPLQLTVRLSLTADRVSALDQLLADQTTAGSANYRKWVTPQAFATQFGATEDQVTAVTAWLAGQQLAVTAVSPSGLRLTVTGAATQVQTAFAVTLQRFQVAGAVHFSNTNQPSVPTSVAELIAGVEGLDDLPSAYPITVSPAPWASGSNATGSLAALEALADANTASVATLSSAACSTDFAQADFDAYRDVLRQANAQGITVVANSGCGARGTGSFPASLAEVTAVVLPAATPGASFAGIEARPMWQFATGLPTGDDRAEPDMTVSSVAALTSTLTTIQQSVGGRVGNINPVLYQLAALPGLFTQPDSSVVAGTWEAATGLGLVDLSMLAKVFPHGTIGSSSLLTVTPQAPVHGAPVTFSTTVTSTGGSGIPTGTVTFTATYATSPTATPGAATTIGTGTLNAAGVATFTTSTLPGGWYKLTSVYSGDGTYTGSTSGLYTLSVVGEPSVMNATVAPGAAVGGNITVHVAVTSASGVGTPSGTVTAAPQGLTSTATASATLTGTGGTATGTILVPIAQAGTFTLLVSCTDSDPSFTCYSPISVPATVAKGASTTALVSLPMVPAIGGTFTLTATVAGMGTAGVPTGNVQFLDGTTILGAGAIASGTASFSGSFAAGKHSFTAVYQGDQNFATSTSPAVTASAGTAATTTTLTAASYAIVVGQTLTLYSSVLPVVTTTTVPTGSVTFAAATQGTIGTANLVGGLATLTLANLAVGTYTLTATYSGDSNFATSASTSSVIVTVGTATATLTGTLSPSSSIAYGTNATLTATATYANATTAPVGSVMATVVGVAGATYTSALTPAAAGSTSAATFSIPAPVPGTYSIQLTCPATGTLVCSGPVTVPMATIKGATATALTLNPTAPVAGEKTVLTATVSSAEGGTGTYTFTGTVAFYANTKLLGTGTVTGATASVSVVLPAGAPANLSAVYSGDGNWGTSTSSMVPIDLALLNSTTAVTSNVTSALAGVQVILTATVSSASAASVVPTGTVTYFDTYNGVLAQLGTSTLVPNGANVSIATLTTSGLLAGIHDIYAMYSGDTVYATSTSPIFDLVFSGYNVSFNPATMTLNAGQTGQAAVTLVTQGGFAGSVSFGCTPPANVEVTCSFSPSMLAGPGTTMLNVVTVAPSSTAQSAARKPLGGFERLAGGSTLALVVLLVLPGRRRRIAPLLLVLLAVALGSVAGCSSGNSNLAGTTTTSNPSQPGDPGSSLGTRILTVTTAGTDGANTITRMYYFQVTIQ